MKKFPHGLFITLEGLEGSGKTTLAQRLTDALRNQGYTVHLVGEPGGTPYGQAARQLFLTMHEQLAPESEIGLLLTCKAQLLRTVVEPALQRHEIVICDRYTDTLFAYQHHAKGHERALMTRMLSAFRCDRMPDLTLLLDISPETSIRRSRLRQQQGGEFTSLDAAPLEFHRKVADGLAREIEPRLGYSASRIDAEQDLETVFQQAMQAIDSQMLRLSTQRSSMWSGCV